MMSPLGVLLKILIYSFLTFSSTQTYIICSCSWLIFSQSAEVMTCLYGSFSELLRLAVLYAAFVVVSLDMHVMFGN
jgi:hypothetical protein